VETKSDPITIIRIKNCKLTKWLTGILRALDNGEVGYCYFDINNKCSCHCCRTGKFLSQARGLFQGPLHIRHWAKWHCCCSSKNRAGKFWSSDLRHSWPIFKPAYSKWFNPQELFSCFLQNIYCSWVLNRNTHVSIYTVKEREHSGSITQAPLGVYHWPCLYTMPTIILQWMDILIKTAVSCIKTIWPKTSTQSSIIQWSN